MSSIPLSCRISGSLSRASHERCRATGESVGHLGRAALADYLQLDHGTLFQVSTAGALVEGLYKGEVTVAALREHGDFGLGTFDGLDGEMVVVDGHFYQVRGDGTVREVEDEVRTPYAMITRFPARGLGSTSTPNPWPAAPWTWPTAPTWPACTRSWTGSAP